MASSSEHQQQNGAAEHCSTGATEHCGTLVPIVEVAFKSDLWWAIPQEMSQELYDNLSTGKTQAIHGIGAKAIDADLGCPRVRQQL